MEVREPWENLCEDLGISYRKRASGALVALCTFHNEKTPSLWMRPSGSFVCYGCGTDGVQEDFLYDVLEARFQISENRRLWREVMTDVPEGEEPF